MIACEPFRGSHLDEIDVQAAQIELRATAAAVGTTYEAAGNAFTLRKDGRIVVCAGVVESDLGAHLWSVIAKSAPLLAVHRAAVRGLELFAGLEISATVRADFPPGCRWLELLGFKRLRTLEGYEDGIDHYHYMKVRTWPGLFQLR